MGTITVFDVSDDGVHRTAEIPTNHILSASRLICNAVAKGFDAYEVYGIPGDDTFTVRYKVGGPVVVTVFIASDEVEFHFSITATEAAEEIAELAR